MTRSARRISGYFSNADVARRATARAPSCRRRPWPTMRRSTHDARCHFRRDRWSLSRRRRRRCTTARTRGSASRSTPDIWWQFGMRARWTSPRRPSWRATSCWRCTLQLTVTLKVRHLLKNYNDLLQWQHQQRFNPVQPWNLVTLNLFAVYNWQLTERLLMATFSISNAKI